MSTFKEIPIKNIVTSKYNYRHACDAAALEELTASVKDKGILEPILVRPLSGKAKGKFEVVAGHRRHKAAIAAKLKTMPCMVSEFTDEEALEIQIVENTQREDPNPMDEAHGFKRLMDMGKHTPETLGVKIGRSVTYVLSRVRLATLDPKVQEAVASGDIGIGHAVIFTRLKNAADQKKFLEDLLEGEWSVRQAMGELSDYTTSLAQAEFDTAGCAACPCRSRNQTELFPELGDDKDSCTDKSCYDEMTLAALTANIKKAAKAGFKTYTKEHDVIELIGAGGWSPKKGVAPITSKKNVGYGSQSTYPSRYEEQCAACLEHHAYYLFTSKGHSKGHHGKKDIAHGEICLNAKCLAAMNKVDTKTTSQTSSKHEVTSNDGLRGERAAQCRDRFLVAAIMPTVEGSVELQRRLCLYALMTSAYPCRSALSDMLTKLGIKHDPNDHSYALASAVPLGSIDYAINSLAVTILQTFSGPDRLLALAADAEVNVLQDFIFDREWLESQSFKNKADLVSLIEELKLDVDVKLSKAKLIDAILACDLKGKVPWEIAETFKKAEPYVPENGQGDEGCQICGMPECDGSCGE